MQKLAIYTMTRDRLDYTIRMISQLYKCGYSYDYFILDNGSNDETPEFLKTLNLKYLYLSPENIGLWRGIEKILSDNNYFQDYDLVLKLDNDLEFPQENWLKNLIEVYNNNHYDILSPFVEGICNGKGGVERIKTDGDISLVPFVGGAALLTDSFYYNNLLLPTNLPKAKGWDSWFCQNKKCGIVENIHVKHDTLEQERTMPEYYARKVKEATEKYD